MDPYSILTNLEEGPAKLFETHLYPLTQGTDTMTMPGTLPDTNSEVPVPDLNPSNLKQQDATLCDNTEVETLPSQNVTTEGETLAIQQPTTEVETLAIQQTTIEVEPLASQQTATEVDPLAIQQPTTQIEPLAIQQPTTQVPLQEEKVLDRNIISDYERKRNPEWFIKGKQSRTPQRYLRLRNCILEYWNHHKPNYVSKSVIRKQIKDCGDVNSFGRIHAFLEEEGYINVNCLDRLARFGAKKPRVPRPTNYEYRPRSPSQKSLEKKRKKNHNLEMWNSTDIPATKSKRRREKPRYTDSGTGDVDSDPYQLVPLEEYNEDYPAPFQVHVNSDALVTVDFHSHLVLTEIIGLLGGTFETNNEGQKILTVKKAFPCKSTSTDIQCEMDPASEMEAREWFAEKGLQVVGWYHSHPTFVAIPSIRDIENQMSYQDLFRIKETGDEPFIGLIINPYNTKDRVSATTYVHISDQVDNTLTFRLPYKCDHSVIPNTVDVADTMDTFEQLVEEYKDHQEKVDMSSKRDGELATDIFLNSLERFVHLDADCCQPFMDEVRSLLTEKFLVLH